MIKRLVFDDQGLGCGLWGLVLAEPNHFPQYLVQYRSQVSGFRLQNTGFRVQGLTFDYQGEGFGVWGSVLHHYPQHLCSSIFFCITLKPKIE